MWQAAIGMVRDRPLLGHGLNRFMAIYLDYWVGGQHQPRYAHNCYLQMAAETGLVGLAAFLALLWTLVAHLAAGARRLTSKEQILLLGLLGGLLVFAAQAAIDTNFYALRQAALFWTLAGLAVGLRESLETDQRRATNDQATSAHAAAHGEGAGRVLAQRPLSSFPVGARG
jgi:putative inorganic carbon (HCO3(-)) transporter